MTELREIIGKAINGWAGGQIIPGMKVVSNDQLADHITAVLIENAGGPEHVMVVKGSAWTVQHPITERFDADTGGTGLFSCKFTQLADVVAESISLNEGDGTFRVWRDDTSAIMWERLK